MDKSEKLLQRELIFYVNGKKIIKCNPDSCLMLSQFLREDLKLTGTKIACDEGGCGSCTVLISKFDRSAASIRHYSSVACLTPVCCLHGLAVTTIEALGSTKTKLHQIQEQLVNCHGVQCGFCSPGMVMSLYALLRNNPRPSQLLVEQAVQGNLCRCTGYRPILDAFKTFAKDARLCPMREQCCRNANSEQRVSNECKASLAVLLSDDSQELIFPPELQLTDVYDKQNLMFGTEADVLWYRPSSLKELLSLKARYHHARLLSGATTVAYSLKSHVKPCVYISTSGCTELCYVTRRETSLVVGSRVTIAQLETVLTDLCSRLPETKTRLAMALLEMFAQFGCVQIRNSATVGGSLAMRNIALDLNVVLMAVAACRINIASEAGCRQVAISDYFIKEKNCLQSNEVLVGIEIPFTDQNEYVGSFKHTARREMSESDVNAAIWFQFEPNSNIIHSARLAVGGVLSTSVAAYDLTQLTAGRKWDGDLLNGLLPQLLPKLRSNVIRSDDVPWKLAAVQGFLQRFYLQVSQQLSRILGLGGSSTSVAGELYVNSVAERRFVTRSGTGVHCERVTGDPGFEVEKVTEPSYGDDWMAQCSTGEAVFIDDMLLSQGELYVSLVTSTKAHALLVEVDAAAALAIPGVVGFLDHSSVSGANATGQSDIEEIFATKEVHWVGQTIGVIVAESCDIAWRAVAAVRITYDELPAIFTMEEAMAQNSFHECPPNVNHVSRGDTKAAFESCDHAVEGEVKVCGQDPFCMETLGVRVVPTGNDGEIHVYSAGEQHSQALQEQLASVLNILSSKVTVHIKHRGGAFGDKGSCSFLVALPTAIAAQRYGRPARCVLDRPTDMQITGYRPSYIAKYKVGFNRGGRLQAVDLTVYSNDGYVSELGWMCIQRLVDAVAGCYAVPNLSARGYACKTNLPPCDAAMLGNGVAQAVFFTEHCIRAVADFLNVPVAVIQQLNLCQPTASSVVDLPAESSLSRCFTDVLTQSCYETQLEQITEFNRRSKFVKRGIEVVPVKYSYGSECNSQNRRRQLFNCYTYAAAVVKAEVDCLTGNYTIPKADIVMDVGKSLYPATEVSQIEAGFVMGLGWFTVEEHKFTVNGHLDTVGVGRYHLPTVSCIPLHMNVTLLKHSVDSNSPTATVCSSKGTAEAALVLSCAVFYAIRSAIKSARADAGLPLDFIFDSPATVSNILLACSKP